MFRRYFESVYYSRRIFNLEEDCFLNFHASTNPPCVIDFEANRPVGWISEASLRKFFRISELKLLLL